MRAVSAARAQPLTAPKRTLSREALKSGATDTALNAAAVVRETWDDFHRSDRFFKYKVAIVAVWVALSAATFFLARPGSGPGNDIGAHLVVAGDPAWPIYMIKNDSDRAWTDVVVLVNGSFRTTAAVILPNRDLTLTPKLLTAESGEPAPTDLRIADIEIRTSEGTTLLLRNGQKP